MEMCTPFRVKMDHIFMTLLDQNSVLLKEAVHGMYLRNNYLQLDS